MGFGRITIGVTAAVAVVTTALAAGAAPDRRTPLTARLDSVLATTAGTQVTYAFEKTVVPKGDRVIRWSISWGDGTHESHTGKQPGHLKHAFARYGRYFPTLTVADARGRISSATAHIFVTAGAPAVQQPAAAAVQRAGTFLVDGQGRVVIDHGVNLVHKTAPFYASTFSAQDAEFLKSEGFTVARVGFIWEGVEPEPGVYDDAYIAKVDALIDLLGRYGIRSLVDMHQDLYSHYWAGGQGDGAPKWASLGSTYLDDFQDFWDDEAASDGIGIQTHFDRMWTHVAATFHGDPNIIGLDPLNEPQGGTASACAPFTLCPQFERTTLASFYGKVIQAIRSVDTTHVIFPEGVPGVNATATALPAMADRQTAFSFHQYCQITQTATSEGPQDKACDPLNRTGLTTETNYARKTLAVAPLVGEFGGGDADDDNADIVDQLDTMFLPWMIWSYYGYPTDPGNSAALALLIDDTKPGSEANAKQPKLDAIAVPHATAIAGTPVSTGFDRTTHAFTLAYSTAAVPGAHLTSGATTIELPQRDYPNGYRVTVGHGTWSSSDSGRVLTVTPDAGASQVTVTVSRA